jgi:hypothetical protein
MLKTPVFTFVPDSAVLQTPVFIFVPDLAVLQTPVFIFVPDPDNASDPCLCFHTSPSDPRLYFQARSGCASDPQLSRLLPRLRIVSLEGQSGVKRLPHKNLSLEI